MDTVLQLCHDFARNPSLKESFLTKRLLIPLITRSFCTPRQDAVRFPDRSSRRRISKFGGVSPFSSSISSSSSVRSSASLSTLIPDPLISSFSEGEDKPEEDCECAGHTRGEEESLPSWRLEVLEIGSILLFGWS